MTSEIQLTEYGLFPSTFRCSKLSELCAEKIGVQTGPFGSQLHKEDYVQVGTPIITVEHLGDNRIIHIDTPFVSDEDRIRLSKYHLQEGDIVFSRVGSVDRRAIVRKEENGWLFSGRCLRLRADKEKIDPLYLSYFFGLEAFKKYIRGIAVGATMPSINTKILSDIPIYYPESLEIQREIAQTFYAIDEKIEINSKSNQTLEAIAQTLFKSWFVDFDPVKAKLSVLTAGGSAEDAERAAMCAISARDEASLNTLQTEQPEAYAELARTAALFPSAMKHSEFGKIPVGWEVGTLGDKYNVVMGQSPKGDTYNEVKEGQLFFQGRAEFGWRYPTPRLYTSSPKRMATKGDILMSVRAPVGDLNIALEDCCIGRGLSALRHNSGSTSFTYYQLKSLQTQLDRFNGEGTVFGSINQKDLKGLQVINPCSISIEAFNKFSLSLDKKIESRAIESMRLSELRDTLLPKLLSGELTLPDTPPTKANPPESDTLEGQPQQQPLMEAAG
ncbi:restriction endonuclease subunit S [Endozoicomonas acroporae]|uniref:restriction endonuclease subunit S n=1 Tax=Endozoicomonas acroporae TaxID=1701104 RepID=UPI000C76BFE1|nr:restriction endonuclease subunit S [Endozoicomonas acroporae]